MALSTFCINELKQTKIEEEEEEASEKKNTETLHSILV